MAKVWRSEFKAKEKAGLPPPSTPVHTDSDPGSRQEEEPTHIAFGSKIVIPKHARKSSREGGASSASGRSSSGLNHSGSIPLLGAVSPAVEPESGRESSRQTHRLSFHRSFSDATNLSSAELSNSHLEVEATQSMIQPRPPRTGSGGKTRRRPFRVKHPGSGNVISRSVNGKDATNNSVKNEVNGSLSKDSVSEDKDIDSNPESISRSQSESSLKTSGNDSSLAESFNKKVQIKIPDKEQNGHNSNYGITSNEQLPQTTEVEKSSPPVFTFSSRPRSAPRSPRSRQRKQHDSNPGTAPSEEKPALQTLDVKDSRSKAQSRPRKDSNRSEYDSDFYKASGESSAEEDDLQNFLKTSGNSRCSSSSSKLSPLPSSSPEPDPLSNSQILRMSIRSSLLKEVRKVLSNISYLMVLYMIIMCRNFASCAVLIRAWKNASNDQNVCVYYNVKPSKKRFIIPLQILSRLLFLLLFSGKNVERNTPWSIVCPLV